MNRKKILGILVLLVFTLFISINSVSAKESFNNYDPNGEFTCGNNATFASSIANTTHYIILIVQIVVPIALIIFGMIDLFKGVISGKDDDIKKNQGTFIKRLIAGICVFLVITITKMVTNTLSTNNNANCIDCFVNGPNHCMQNV